MVVAYVLLFELFFTRAGESKSDINTCQIYKKDEVRVQTERGKVGTFDDVVMS